jgi:hypothetical protein
LISPNTKLNRIKALDSPKKVKLLNDIPGTGKSTDAIEYCFNTNKNNIVYFNNWDLAWEFFGSVRRMKLKVTPIFHFYYGMFKQLSTLEQKTFKFRKEYPCDQCRTKELFNWLRSGFRPSNYCRDICSRRKVCSYRKYINDNFNQAKNVQKLPKINNLNYMTKAHIHTDLTTKIFKTFDNINVIMDENFFDMLYHQIDLNSYNLFKYKQLMMNISGTSKKLNEFWVDFSMIVNLLIDLTRGWKRMKPEFKRQKIIKEIKKFLDVYKVSDIEKWNESISHKVIKNPLSFKRTSINLTNYFVQIFEDVANTKKTTKILERTLIDQQEEMFSYIINRRESILKLINTSNKFIITSSVLNSKIFEEIFPELKHNYITFKDNRYKPKFKKVYRYTSGSYPKYVLWKGNKPRKSFYNLLKITKDILLRHKHESIMLIAFKAFLPIILREIEPIIKKYDINFTYDYWYNIEGKNKYSNYDIQIQFGLPGKPTDYINALANLLKVDVDLISEIVINGEQIQGAERLRSIHFPHQKIVYQLSKEINDYYNTQNIFKNLLEIRHRNLLKYITSQGRVSINQVQKSYFLSRIKHERCRIILEELLRGGFLKKSKKSTSIGRPEWIYQIK